MNAPAKGLDLVDVFLRLRPQLRAVLIARLGDAQAADDLLQDLFLRLPRVSENLRNAEQAQHYMMRMARNASIDLARGESRRAELLLDAIELFDHRVPTPEDYALSTEQLETLDEALHELPGKTRDMLILSRLDGLTHGQIAERLGVSRSLVEKRLVQAVLHCRARIREDD